LPGTARARLSRAGSLSILTGLAFVVLAAQLAVLLVRSLHQYRAFNLSVDFGLFFQAWHQIGHGHLSPYLSDYELPFWRSHFELIMWPLAPLYWLNRSDGRTLLFLQDLAIVASEAIGFAWVVLAARRARLSRAAAWAVGVVVVALLIADPLVYRAAQQDFHFEAFATCFALAAGLDLWRGHDRRAWLWVVLTLACGDVAGTYIAGLGLAFAIGLPDRRRQGLALTLVGVGWVVFLAALGANKGSGTASYAYLAGVATLPQGGRGVVDIVKGVVAHPSRPVHQISKGLSAIRHNLAPGGYLGIVGPFTFGVVILVLLENGLNGRSEFLRSEFQNVPVFLFTTVGTMLLVISIAQSVPRLRLVATLLLAASVTSALIFDWHHRHVSNPYRVPASIASQLQAVRIQIPDSAEVVSTYGVVGRFSGRRWVYAIAFPKQPIPIRAKSVFFVIAPTAGNQPVPAATLNAMWAMITALPSIKTIATGPDVLAAQWTPSANTTLVVPSG
jgi:hypothetical protein